MSRWQRDARFSCCVLPAESRNKWHTPDKFSLEANLDAHHRLGHSGNVELSSFAVVDRTEDRGFDSLVGEAG